MKLSETYRKLLRIPEANVVLLPDEPIRVASLNNGVVFVLAVWAGASQLSFRTLNEVLTETPDHSSVTLYVANTDYETTEAFIRQQGDVPNGNGETYWIKNGQVVAKLPSCHTRHDVLRQFMQQLIG